MERPGNQHHWPTQQREQEKCPCGVKDGGAPDGSELAFRREKDLLQQWLVTWVVLLFAEIGTSSAGHREIVNHQSAIVNYFPDVPRG
jgi:hypothetical protein